MLLSKSQQKYHLESLAHLPSTGEIQAKGNRGKDWEHMMAQAQERDVLQAARPVGCWCLGLGGKRIENTIDGSYRTHWEPCTCPEAVAETERQRLELAAEDLKERDKAWGASEVPQRFRGMTLRSSPLVKTMPRLIRRLTWPKQPREDHPQVDTEMNLWGDAFHAWNGSWFFSGPFGVGKTGLAVGYAREKVYHDWDDYGAPPTLLFRSLPKLLAELRATYNRRGDQDDVTEAKLLARYQKVGLFILDDLGAEQVTSTGWMEDRLYQIIGDRHDEERPMVFTSNFSLTLLAKRIGERLTWRILEMCGKDRIIEVKGPNLRDTEAV